MLLLVCFSGHFNNLAYRRANTPRNNSGANQHTIGRRTNGGANPYSVGRYHPSSSSTIISELDGESGERELARKLAARFKAQKQGSSTASAGAAAGKAGSTHSGAEENIYARTFKTSSKSKAAQCDENRSKQHFSAAEAKSQSGVKR